MERLLKVIQEVFPDFKAESLDTTLLLGNIDGWDSMSVVTFSMKVEQTFKVDLGGETLRESDTIAALVALLRNKGAVVS